MIKRENSIISNRLNHSTCVNRSLNSSYISKLSAIKSKVDKKNEVKKIILVLINIKCIL